MNKFASITKPLVWLMALLLAAVVAGCGGSSTTASSKSLVSIAVTPVAALIAVSGTQQLAATGTYSDMSTAAVTASWTSATPTVATVNATGLVTGVANGTSVITATFGGKTTTATMTVSNATLVSIALTTTTPTTTISIGGTKQFVATGTYSDLSQVIVAASWTSGTTSIATVSNTGLTAGLATGVANGISVISATFGGKTATATLTVSAAAATSVLPGIAGSAGANLTNPTVITANPSNGDTNVPISIRGALHTNLVGPKLVTATFSGAMDPVTINSATPGALSTFTLKDMTTGAGSIVSGTVAMNTANTIATFTPTANLTPGTNYTASISTAAKNTGSVTAMPMTVSWSFTTRAVSSANQASPFVGQAPIDLLTAGNFVILAQAAITDVPASVITGDIGLSSAAGSNIFVSCAEMAGTGKIYTVDTNYAVTGFAACSMPGPAANKTYVDQAVLDKGTAYTEAAGRTFPDASNVVGATADIGGLTFYPGLYSYTAATGITTNVTLDAQGDTNAVWIFQITGDLTVASGASVPAGIKVILTNGAKASNVFWQVAASNFGVTLNTNSTFNGNILSSAQVIANTGAVVNGRLFAVTQVTLQQNTVTQPAP